MREYTLDFDSILDSDDIDNAFCENCPAIFIERGSREDGLATGPDYTSCPAEFDRGDDKCIKGEIFERLKAKVSEIDSLLEEAEAYGRK